MLRKAAEAILFLSSITFSMRRNLKERDGRMGNEKGIGKGGGEGEKEESKGKAG